MNVRWMPGVRAAKDFDAAPLKLLFGNTQRRTTPDSQLPSWTAPSAKDTFTYAAQSGQPPEPLQTNIETLIDGGQIFGKVKTLMDSAKSSVMLNLYNLQNPALYPEKSSVTGTPGAAEQAQVIDRLVALKEKGLKVRVILDNSKDPDMGENHNDRTINYLRSKGVEVLTYPDYAKISHVKLLVVDDNYAVIGGMNWGNHSASNHDAAVLIEGPDVRNIYNDIFKTDWLTAGGEESDIPDLPKFDEGQIKVLTTSPKESVDGGRRSIFNEILGQIGKAQESIYAELFVLTQSDIVDNLIFAHKRLKNTGKEGVKILVDPGLYFAFPNTRKGVQKLALAGVPIKFYKANRDIDQKLHAKWAVFDKKTLMIGSANWSSLGLLSNGNSTPPASSDSPPPVQGPKVKGNHEANVLISSKPIAKPFVDQFWFDWQNRAFPILVKKEDGSGGWQKLQPTETPLFA